MSTCHALAAAADGPERAFESRVSFAASAGPTLRHRKAAFVPATLPNRTTPAAPVDESIADRCFDDFALHVSFRGQRSVLRVRGDVDMSTSPTLRAHLSALIELGHHDIVLDLAALTFMSAAGLGVIAEAAARLAESDGLLWLRAPPAMTLRLLEIAGLMTRVQIDPADSNAQIRSALVRAASLPARNEQIDAELLIVVAVASATLDGADGVSVTLERHGRLMTVAATNDTVLQMDAHQYETGEGPCLSAATEGVEFHIESLADESRWPAFLPLALGEGIASILSRPLTDRGRPVGALNVYSNTAGTFGPDHQELAVMFAEQASRIVADPSSDPGDAEMGTRITHGLHSRLVLAQAQGVIMTRHQITAAEATATLHRAARAAGTTVLEHAAQVVASTHEGVGPLDRLGHG